MCVWSVDEFGKALAGSKLKKKTRWITNSAAIASALKNVVAKNHRHTFSYENDASCSRRGRSKRSSDTLRSW
jgi:hypothetical protein